MAGDPHIFWCHFVKHNQGTNPEKFDHNISGRFFLNVQKVKIPIRPHVEWKKSYLRINARDPQLLSMNLVQGGA